MFEVFEVRGMLLPVFYGFFLHVSLDSLVFGDNARGPDEEFQLRFEALKDFTPSEKTVARELLDSLILKHTANRLSANVPPDQRLGR
jgi:hypothetical protein